MPTKSFEPHRCPSLPLLPHVSKFLWKLLLSESQYKIGSFCDVLHIFWSIFLRLRCLLVLHLLEEKPGKSVKRHKKKCVEREVKCLKNEEGKEGRRGASVGAGRDALPCTYSPKDTLKTTPSSPPQPVSLLPRISVYRENSACITCLGQKNTWGTQKGLWGNMGASW